MLVGVEMAAVGEGAASTGPSAVAILAAHSRTSSPIERAGMPSSVLTIGRRRRPSTSCVRGVEPALSRRTAWHGAAGRALECQRGVDHLDVVGLAERRAARRGR